MSTYPVYPCPNWAVYSDTRYVSPARTVSLWHDGTCPAALELLQRALGRFGFATEVTDEAATAIVVLGRYATAPVAERLRGYEALTREALPVEGYYLVTDGRGAVVAGADGAGSLYGAGTLAQLAECVDGMPAFRQAQVRDWPYKRIRAAHLYLPGRENIPYFNDVVTWLASLRYNTLFLEVGGGMRYDRHPEVNEAWARFCREAVAYPGGPEALQGSQPYPKDSTHTELARGGWLEKEEVASLIAHANRHGIEVVPELQALSHSYYLVTAHPEIAERSWDPWPDTYCPSDPRSYELYFDLADEVIEVFRPRLFHIGHDEAYTFGICDRCHEKSGAELLAGDLWKLRDYFVGRGIRPVMWGDKLQNIIIGGDELGGRACSWAVNAARRTDHIMRETYQAVDFVPKDTLIMDWYWGLDPLSERFFMGKGFELLFGNFGHYEPWAYSGWGKRSGDERLLGTSTSTWSDVSDYAFGHNLIYFNFLYSANLQWWRHFNDRERENNLAAVAAMQPWTREELGQVRLPSLDCCPATPVDLSPAANLTETVLTTAEGEWLETAPCRLPLAQAAVMADVHAPNGRPLPFGGAAASLVFLHYCETERRYRFTFEFEDPLAIDDFNLLGYYLVTYADGSSEKVEIRHGDNITGPYEMMGEGVTSSPFWAQPAWEGRDREGQRLMVWVNPRPADEIATVQLHYGGREAGERVVLLALGRLG
ncbi:MAG: family 20 glycosylhydrolase [Anaerolineae bacterium]